MRYLAIDVETANADYSSICQIGIAEFENGKIIDKWSSLINPESYFDPFNVSIHKIKESDVINSPTFDKLHPELAKRLEGKITIHHMPFDRTALNRVCQEYNLPVLNTQWLDSAKIARRTWEQFAYKGYGLKNIADFLDISFDHHDALKDAMTAGIIVYKACELTEMQIDDWLIRVGKPINLDISNTSSSSTIKQDGNPEGALYGENIVFTGALSIPRKEAAAIAAQIGCKVLENVTQKTTILVVGTQDSTRLAGYDKSSKHRKAEGLIEKGKQIKILTENDFINMCNEEGEILIKHSSLSPAPKTSEVNKKSNTVTSLEVEIPHDLIKKANELFESLPQDQKDFLEKSAKEYKEFINSISDCSHDEKRQLANDFKSKIDNIEKFHNENNLESYEDDFDILITIESELDELRETVFDLMKNKMTLGEFFESLDDSIDFIDADMDNSDMPDIIKEYSTMLLKELNQTKEKIKTLANIL